MASPSKLLITCLTLNILFGLLGCTGSSIWLEGLSKNDLHTSKVTNRHLIFYMQTKHLLHKKPDENILEEIISRWDLTTNEIKIVTSMGTPSSRIHIGSREIVMRLSQSPPAKVIPSQTGGNSYLFRSLLIRGVSPLGIRPHRTFTVQTNGGKVTAINYPRQ